MIAQVGGDTPAWLPWVAAGLVVVALAAALVVGLQQDRARSRYGAVLAASLAAPEPVPMRWFVSAFLAVIGGYLFFDRGFAWIHVPGTPLFIGELVLGLGSLALLTSRVRIGRIINLTGSLQVLTAWLVWGGILLGAGIMSWGVNAVRDSALWYYGLIAVLVAFLVMSRPARLSEWTTLFGRTVPFLLLWLPAANLLSRTFSGRPPFVPDSVVSVFAHRPGNIAVLAATIVAFLWLVDRDSAIFRPDQRALMTALATVVILVTGVQNRGGFVAAFLAIIAMLLFLARRRGDVLAVVVGVVLTLVSVFVAFDVRLDTSRKRSLSVEQLVTNITSVFAIDSGGERQSGTTRWRLDIWGQVINDVTFEAPLTGFGPGPNLGERYGVQTRRDIPLRSPHNSHIGVLSRMGWVGALLWAAFWMTWYLEMLLLRRRTRTQGRLTESRVAAWLMVAVLPILVNAIFDPTLEGPQVAMWLWTLVGVGASMVILERAGALPALVAPQRDWRPVSPGKSHPTWRRV